MYKKIIFNAKALKDYKDCICSFEISKQAKLNGITNTNLSPICFDKDGELSDGEWIQGIHLDWEYYPAISFIMAGQKILEDLGTQALDAFNFYQKDKIYFIAYKGETLSSENIIDVMVLTWIKHRPKIN